MTRKSALAGLPYGGAKAVLMESPLALVNRDKIFAIYAQAVERLGGVFVTGSDVGVSDDDVVTMRGNSQYIIGAKVPAGYYTALGVLRGVHAALEEIYGKPEIKGRSFAIQGLGKTGLDLMKLLYEKGGDIVVSDINKELLASVQKEFPKIRVVDPGQIHAEKVDVFCPCALSHSLNEKTVKELAGKSVIETSVELDDTSTLGP